jgi:general secretion pathway protein C
MVAGPALDPAIAKGIQRLGATEFAIDRGTLDRIIEAQAELMRNVQLAPERDAEKVTGLRLGGIRGGSLLATIGLENGDRLQSINGFDLTNPEKALEAFARLRTQEKLVLQVTRRGKATNLDYTVR